VLKNVTFHLD